MVQVEVGLSKESLKGLVTQVSSRWQQHRPMAGQQRELTGVAVLCGVQVAVHRNSVSKIEAELHEARSVMERYLIEYDQLFREAEKSTEALERQVRSGSQPRKG